jgi:Secretion system C-terminal sorting domain
MRYIFTLCCAFVMTIVVGQEVLSSTYLKSYEKSFFTGNFGLFSSFDVDLYRVKYTTVDVKGNPTEASGLVCLPSDNKNFYPIVAYHHGTVGSRFEVPGYESYEAIIPSIFTSMGFVGIAPDYLGLGDSPGIHPYVHAASEATAARDLLIATEKFLASKDYKTNKNLFITGYSQGGHASMAFHRMMEANNLGYKLKAASHMSGPYSISSGMKELLLSDKEYSIVAYMAEVALAYNLVYGIFPDNDMNKFFKPTYAKLLKKFADEELGLFDMNTVMVDSLKKQFGKALPKKMLLDSILNVIISDDNHPVNAALRDNDVYDWKPTIPTRLLYCTADEQVAYTNSIIALEKMKANGAANVTATDVRTNGSHSDCVNPAVTNTLFFFLQYLNLTAVEDVAAIGECAMYPNPASDRVIIASETSYGEATLIAYDGKMILKTVANNTIDISDINAGLYIVLLKDKQTGTTVHGKIFKSR